MEQQPTTPTQPGAIINGVHYLSRMDIMELYKLTNNKSHRLLSAKNLTFVYAYDRRFYAFDEVIAYLNTQLYK